MQLEPYLNFNGTCEEAFNFYAGLLGGKIDFSMTHGNSPMAGQTPPEWKDKILHMSMSFHGNTLLGCDAPPGRYEKPIGVWISVSVAEPAEADRIFNALQEKGSIVMPIEKTFWALRFGMTYDRFGTPWMINCHDTSAKL